MATTTATELDVNVDNAFDNDSDEWEEETQEVIFEFGTELVVESIARGGHQCRLIGIDGPNPYIQIGNQLFRGCTIEGLGTDMIFTGEKEQHQQNSDPLINSESPQRMQFHKVSMVPYGPVGTATAAVSAKELFPSFEAIRKATIPDSIKYTIDDPEWMVRSGDTLQDQMNIDTLTDPDNEHYNHLS